MHLSTNSSSNVNYEIAVKFAKLHLVRQSGRGTVHSRPHKIFLQFQGLWTLLSKITEGVALTPLSILHKTH